MATGDKGGAAAPPVAPVSDNNPRMQPRKPPPAAKPAPKEQPGRSPQGPAPVQPQPIDPPHPVLQAAGFQGPVSDFNHRVETIVPAYQQAHGGQIPAPGLVLDIARSPVAPTDYNKLFEPSFLDPGMARLSGAVAKQATPTTVRPDGLIVQHTPITTIMQNVQPLSDNSAPMQPLTPQEMLKAHPWVPQEAGFIPGINFGATAHAAGVLLGYGVGNQNGQMTVGGMTLDELQHHMDVARFAPGGTVAQRNAAGALTRTPEYAKAEAILPAILTMKQSQQTMQDKYPAWFKGLPVTGNWNDDWSRALHRFQSSATYYQAADAQIAKDNYLTTAELPVAWKRKQDLINSDPRAATAAAAIPLAFFGNGQSIANFITGGAAEANWGLLNVPTNVLHTVSGTARTIFAGASAISDAAKSNLAYMTKFLQEVAPAVIGEHVSLEQAHVAAGKAAEQNPTWLRAIYPDLPTSKDEPGWLKGIDLASNFVVDIWAGNKLVPVGSSVRIGDYAGLASNRVARQGTKWAFNGAKQGGNAAVGEMSAAIQGGETLNRVAAPLIRDGNMSLAQYRQHVSDLYHHGTTDINGETINVAKGEREYVFRSLSQKERPNPSGIHRQIKASLDSYEQVLRDSGKVGTDNAANMFSGLRQLFGHAVQTRARIMDPKAPENLYNWTVTHLGDRELAYRVRNDLVVMRSKDDIPGIQKLVKGLNERYAAENPVKTKGGIEVPLAPSGPELASESLSYMTLLDKRLPDTAMMTGGEKVMVELENKARQMNAFLNHWGAFHRQLIIGVPLGGESLFYKHAFADTTRRFVGGGGAMFNLNKQEKAWKGEVENFFHGDPQAMLDHGASKAQAIMGEQQWIKRSSPESIKDFTTHGAMTGPQMDAAGGFVRRQIATDALQAFRLSSRSDVSPLFRYVWKDRFQQNKIAADSRFVEKSAELKASLKGERLTAALSDLKKEFAQERAEVLWRNYQDIQEAGSKVGQPDLLSHLQQVAIENIGPKSDTAIGKEIKKLGAEIKVGDAVATTSHFDNVMQDWIGKLMYFNKLNRRVMFEKVFYQSYGEMRKAGWDPENAIAASTSIARDRTVYHMLDFSNMLQVEQNLRWVSYFATKHRLYWTWIAQQFAHKPLLAAAVADIGNQLDRGNVNMNLGQFRLQAPVERLFWVNNTDLPETSALVDFGAHLIPDIVKEGGVGQGFAADFAQQTATQGNVFTRDDQAIFDLIHYIKGVSGGNASYAKVTANMSPIQLSSFNKEMHNYILSYRAEHNGRYPGINDALNATHLRSFAQELWRANLFLPVTFQKTPGLGEMGTPPEVTRLMTEYHKITDPAKARDFLAKNPKLTDSFGASGNQEVWLHNAPLWDAFRKATLARDGAMDNIREQLDSGVSFTVLAKQAKQVSTDYRQALYEIRKTDAAWPGNATYPKGEVSAIGQITQQGPWATQLDGDPLAANAFLHQHTPNIPQRQLDKHTVTAQIQYWRDEIGNLHDLGFKKSGLPQKQWRDAITALNQKIAVFNSLPKNPTSQMESAYFSRYWKPYDKMRDRLNAYKGATSSADKDAADALAREIQARYDHPVEVTDPVTGKKVTFPSPVAYGYTQLTPLEYHTALANAAQSQWDHLPNYEKNLLGVKTPTSVAAGWAVYEKLVSEHNASPSSESLHQIQRERGAKFVDKGGILPNGEHVDPHPGFYKDFLFAQRPKIERWQATSLYQSMPDNLKQQLNERIPAPGGSLPGIIEAAKLVISHVKAEGYKNYRLKQWRAYVKDTVVPWLNEPAQKQLKDELAKYGPLDRVNPLTGQKEPVASDFLNTLVSSN